MSSSPLMIEDTNLSRAWGRVLLSTLGSRGRTISPLVVSVHGFDGESTEEDAEIRRALDTCLAEGGLQKVETVANTIFPQSVWRLSGYDRAKFYKLYIEEGFPSYKALAPSKNRRGLYFERLVAFGSGPHDGNQLEHIISEYTSRSGVRRSMFQAAIFDPGRDHIHDAYLIFPCLQHISLVPSGGEVTLNAFYATQQLIDKAYGNFLGLCRLGHFMAREMGLQLSRMNCFIGVEKLDQRAKSPLNLKVVEEAVLSVLPEQVHPDVSMAAIRPL